MTVQNRRRHERVNTTFLPDMKNFPHFIYNRRNVTTCAQIHSIYILSGDIQLDVELLIRQIKTCDMNQNNLVFFFIATLIHQDSISNL